uniref:Vezatin n=1 Tax=Dendroctonus ponderosae TaxID=77166 RepID=A0AAR5P610_DENPD
MSRNTQDQYGALLVQHLKSILESGLLLDEDYEVLLQRCNFQVRSSHPRRRPWEILAGGVAALVAWKCRQPIIALSALAATIVSICLQRRDIARRKRRREIIDCVLKSFLKGRKLNAGVVRYLKMRKIEDFGAHIQEFLEHFVGLNKEHFALMLKNIDLLVCAQQELQQDFVELQQLDLHSLLTLDELRGENYHKFAERVNDIATLLTSKYLNYLGLTLCEYLSDPNPSAVERLWDQQLPRVRQQLDQLHTVLQKEFNNLRYNAAQKLEITSVVSSYFGRQLSGKLQQTVMGAINNLSLIMERSRTVLSKVQEIDDLDDVKKLETTLSELRCHALDTYESLDVLCRLCGILSQSKPQHVSIPLGSDNNHGKESLDTVHYDDDTEVVEEDFELFIPAGQEVEPVVITGEGEDQSSAYLGLMLKELQQSLQQHERFAAARRKRVGPMIEVHHQVEERELPKFDLNQLSTKTTPKSTPIPAPRQLTSSEEVVEKVPPPPPPAPPPPFLLPEAAAGDKGSPKTLLENIRTLSSQLKGREEIFGDDAD